MSEGRPLRLVAHLTSPLSGEAPHLDSLLVSVASRIYQDKPEAGYKITRSTPLPNVEVDIPLFRRRIDGMGIAFSSSPILARHTSEWVDYTTKKIGVEHAGLLDPKERKQVNTTGGWTKSYRLPERIRRVDRIAWLCWGNRREILKALREVKSIGEHIASGYGRVSQWECEVFEGPTHAFWPLWIPNDNDQNVLMRPLPFRWEGLPQRLIGWRQDFGACVGPYWHKERWIKVVTPC